MNGKLNVDNCHKVNIASLLKIVDLIWYKTTFKAN